MWTIQLSTLMDTWCEQSNYPLSNRRIGPHQGILTLAISRGPRQKSANGCAFCRIKNLPEWCINNGQRCQKILRDLLRWLVSCWNSHLVCILLSTTPLNVVEIRKIIHGTEFESRCFICTNVSNIFLVAWRSDFWIRIRLVLISYYCDL